MRLRTWMAFVALLTTGLCLSGEAVAQGDPFAGGGYPPPGAPPFVDPGCQHGCPPGTHGADGGGLHALHGASVPMGYPPGAQPFPQISPFETGMTKHRTWNGLWVRDQYGPQRQYFSRISGTVMSPRRIHGSPIELVGDAATYGDANDGILAGDGSSIITNKVFEDDPNPIGPRDSNQIREKLKDSPGVRGAIGWITPGDYGVEFNAWLTPSDTGLYSRGTGDFKTGNGTPSTTHSLGLPSGTVPFDLRFQLEYTSLSAGGGVNFLSNDVWPSEHVGLRVMYGVRYVHIWEEFAFRGIHSGPPINRQVFNSIVRTNLVGPQMGLDYSFGGDTFKIAGQSKAGVMVNFTEYQLGGVGVGNPASLLYDPLLRFSEVQEHTNLTPLFEQNLRLEMDLVPMIPVLNKSYLLKNSRIHVGYWVLLGWEIARPHNQIVYQDQPETLVLKSHLAEFRDQWYTHGWEFGFSTTW